MSEWKKEKRGEPWYPGETLSAAIGQGYNLVTPLQMAVLTAAVANRGTLYRPGLIKKVMVQPHGGERRVFSSRGRPVGVKGRSLELIRSALAGVVQEERGTGRAAAIDGLAVSGKTGTAQVIRLQKNQGEREGDQIPWRYRDHAWFISYAPGRGESQIAMAILVEHGGHGGAVSAPLAGIILREMKNMGYFRDAVRM